MSLKAGQVVRIGSGLFKVDFINACRARVVPLGSRKVTRTDGSEFYLREQSISANAPLEIIDDIEAARAKIELEDAEREVKLARKEIISEREQREQDVADLAAAEAELAALRAHPAAAAPAPKRPPTSPASGSGGGGWLVGPTPAPAFRAGTLAAQVMAYIVANPGQSTKDIVDGVPVDGAVAACVSRFNQAGYIHKA